ncbi:MAG: hypothetical protein DRQ78_05375 [Epsilonproteobacteria bacterium]|nr:MAG: hypothetical protein DRQ78_05375 [Campylobacterota bacterium]
MAFNSKYNSSWGEVSKPISTIIGSGAFTAAKTLATGAIGTVAGAAAGTIGLGISGIDISKKIKSRVQNHNFKTQERLDSLKNKASTYGSDIKNRSKAFGTRVSTGVAETLGPPTAAAADFTATGAKKVASGVYSRAAGAGLIALAGADAVGSKAVEVGTKVGSNIGGKAAEVGSKVASNVSTKAEGVLAAGSTVKTASLMKGTEVISEAYNKASSSIPAQMASVAGKSIAGDARDFGNKVASAAPGLKTAAANLGGKAATKAAEIGVGLGMAGLGTGMWASGKVSPYLKSTSNWAGAKSKLFDERMWQKRKDIDASNKNMINRGHQGPHAPGGTTAGNYFAKSAMALTVGSGITRETAMNAAGFLTRHQKSAMKMGGMAAAQAWMIPLGAATGGAMTMMDGGGLENYVGGYVIPGAALVAGASAGYNLGQGLARLPGLGGLLGKGIVGGFAAAGTVALGAAGIGLGDMFETYADSNNMTNEFAESMKYAKFTNDFDTSQKQLTHRQRTLSKLSKSGLNDRGTLLGNEAQVIAGII